MHIKYSYSVHVYNEMGEHCCVHNHTDKLNTHVIQHATISKARDNLPQALLVSDTMNHGYIY